MSRPLDRVYHLEKKKRPGGALLKEDKDEIITFL